MQHRFTTAAEAQRYIRAMGRSRLYTVGSAPPLPRCDHPRWTGESVRGRGKVAPCSCTSRTDVNPGCPHATMQHSNVRELRGAFFVDADEREPSVAGERVDVDGSEVVLNRVPSRTLTRAEHAESRAHWPVRETDEEYTGRRGGQ